MWCSDAEGGRGEGGRERGGVRGLERNGGKGGAIRETINEESRAPFT